MRAGFGVELDEVIASIGDSRRWIASLEGHERERTGINKLLKVGYNKVFGYYIEVSNSKLGQVPADYIRKQTLVNAERYITPDLKKHDEPILSPQERIAEIDRRIYSHRLLQLT